jgi:hypothetical protein
MGLYREIFSLSPELYIYVMVRERDPIRNLTSADGGIYTCEIETDLDSPLTLSHTLQILGKKKFTRKS